MMINHTTQKVGPAEENRRLRVAGLLVVHADTYMVYLKTQNYYWNVVGPMFGSLRQVFGNQKAELSDGVDDVAERIRALGAKAPGSFRSYAALTNIAEESSLPSSRDMVAQLVADHETATRSIQAVVPSVKRAGDLSTETLLANRMRFHGTAVWNLRAMLE